MKTLKKLPVKIAILFLLTIIVIFTSCKKSNNKLMEQTTNNSQPVIDKKFEAKYVSNNIYKDTIQIVFIKQLNIDSNEYTLKNIFKAVNHYLKPNSTITNVDYDLLSNEKSSQANFLGNKYNLSIFPDGRLILVSSEITIPNIQFNKI